MPCDKKPYTFTRQELFDIQRALDTGEGTEEAAQLIQAVLDYDDGDWEDILTPAELEEIINDDYA
jgi:hypothetical protein